MRATPLLVIGAGPYGLAAAAAAKRAGLDPLVFGEPMSFWRQHMPKGMLLRSGVDWHLDADETHTLAAFLHKRRIDPASALPIPVELFIEYASWFQERVGLDVTTARVTRLGREDGHLIATLDTGERIAADAVLATPGLAYFPNLPDHPVLSLPRTRWGHTCHLTDFDSLAGKRCLIVGGRQSAFESTALIAERGAAQVHVCYRHDTPRFEPSDWSWVDALVDTSVDVRGWFRALPAPEREAIERRFWQEGRLKLEPWLLPRISRNEIRLWPGATVSHCHVGKQGEIRAILDDGTLLEVDHAVLATGYKVEVENVPYLADLLAELQVRDGSPVLNEDLESSVPGLFFAGLVAARDFGPFFGFVRGCPAAARILVDGLRRRFG